MRSRMDRYRELDNDTERTSRSRRNQELYQNIGTNAKYTNFTDVTNSNTTLIDRNRRDYSTREDYQKRKEYTSFENKPKVKKELDDFNHLYQDHENRVYDINSILEMAKENRKDKDSMEEKRKLKNTNYNILASLNPEELEKYRKEKQNKNKPDDNELRGLIDTITSKTLAGEISKETGVDLLSDLMATSALDKVPAESDIKQDESNDKDSIENKDILNKEDMVKVEEAKKDYKEPSSDIMRDIDKSFYTKSMDLSDKDFFTDEDDDNEKHIPVIVKVLLILILVALVAVGACFLYQSL